MFSVKCARTSLAHSVKDLLMARPSRGRSEVEWLLSELRDKSAEFAVNKLNDKRVSILDAAREVLIEDGYAKFTLRGVAHRAGIHLKTLQYYFDTKGKLLAESLNYTLDNYYFNKYIQLYRGLDSMSSADALTVTIEYLLSDITDERTRKLFAEVWALAGRDAEAEQALDSLYSRHRQHLQMLISRVNPRLPVEKVALRATLIAAQVEGLMLFMGTSKPQHPELAGLRDEALRAALLQKS